MRRNLIIALVVVIVAFGIYSGIHELWWFKPAYSQRQTAQAFFSDLSSSKNQAAYNLTSSVYQSANSYSSFDSSINVLNKDSLGVSYSTYTVASGWTTIVGEVKDKTSKNNYAFGMQISNTSKPYKIGVIDITPTQS